MSIFPLSQKTQKYKHLFEYVFKALNAMLRKKLKIHQRS